MIWAILGHIVTQAGEELKGAKDEDGALAPLVASDITMGLNPILSASMILIFYHFMVVVG